MLKTALGIKPENTIRLCGTSNVVKSSRVIGKRLVTFTVGRVPLSDTHAYGTHILSCSRDAQAKKQFGSQIKAMIGIIHL